ncbi:hypothetical protein [Neolewinella antarctica]|uniref:Uncharacterized protein n=1 Tax=Neolewinella antarctica TaxID=442734 RepID=A0ABX0XIE2_9BACT|nr:hypothetical protein [Neolewinella antarctica]NJC28502.1 hypothetical protein [Neolewinella antarctica]
MDTTTDKQPSFFQRYRWLLLVLLLFLVGGGGYYYTQQNDAGFNLTDAFNRYRQEPATATGGDVIPADSLLDIPPVTAIDTVPTDTLPAARVPDSFMGFALPVYDTLPPIYADSVIVDSFAIADSIARLADNPMDELPEIRTVPQVPSEDDEIMVANDDVFVATSQRSDDIFDGLLPGTYQSPAAERTFLENYSAKAISTRGVYKLAAIAGKSFLLKESPEVLEIFNTLLDEEAINSIAVSDRQGRIRYASNSRERGRMAADVYVDLPVTNEAINWMRRDGLTTTGIPVFSVGGRLGTVFVVTQ